MPLPSIAFYLYHAHSTNPLNLSDFAGGVDVGLRLHRARGGDEGEAVLVFVIFIVFDVNGFAAAATRRLL
jgi:hypothetical protein